MESGRSPTLPDDDEDTAAAVLQNQVREYVIAWMCLAGFREQH